MLLKKLRLRGFKSFADKTDLEFAPGINVVVGPNGSGKSNVVDALTWVMGTQMVRQLRGGSMEDVIFAGTPARQPLGRAEVELVVDNAEGVIPLEMAEVSLGRTLFRSGESRYVLNGEQVRLLDVVEILSDAGVGRTFHNVVGQGRIDAILQASPQERRVAIEEAAGVLKHRKRRERSLRRLEAVEADLVRLDDVHRELRRRIKPLERQIEGAAQYEELSTERGVLARWRAGEQVRLRRRELGELSGRLRSASSQLTGETQARDVLAAQVAADEVRLETLGTSVEEAAALNARLERVLTRHGGVHRVGVERERALESRISKLDESARADTLDVPAETAATEERLSELRAAQERAAEEQDHLEAELAVHAESVAHLDAAWHAAGLDDDERRAAIEAQHGAAKAALERLESEQARAEERRLSARAARDELAAVLTHAAFEQVTDAATPLGRKEAARRRLAERAEAEARALETEERQLVKEASAQRARAESLESAVAESEGTRAAHDEVRRRFGSMPRVRDLVKVDPADAAAVDVGIPDLLDAVLLPPDSATGVLETVKGVDKGTLTLAEPLSHPEIASLAGSGASPLATLLTPLDTPYRAEVAALVARHAARVRVAEDAAAAHALSREIPGSVFVTREGDRFEAGVMTVRAQGANRNGRVTFGAAAARRAADGSTARAKAASVAAGRWREEADRLRKAHDEVRADITELERRRSADEDTRRRRERQLAEAERELETATEQLGRLGGQLEGALARRGELAAQIASAAPTATEAERARLRERRVDLDTSGSSLRQRSSEIERDQARDQERTRQALQRLDELERLAVEQARRRAAEADERHRIGVALSHLERVVSLVGRAESETQRRLTSATGVVDERRRELVEARAGLSDVRSRHAAADERVRELTALRHELEVSEAEARTRLESAEDAPRRELRVTLAEALGAALPEDREPGSVDERIEELDRRLARLGPVNPLALEEYEELRARRDLLDSELEDVRNARRELLGVVRDLDRRIAEILQSACDDVARHFSDLFGVLFPGGDGRMILTEPENILETGIEIEARPSGKSPKRLSLLSGGERTLSALAFLFGVFRARPSPFYVLDEVEAALDDLNLARFCNLLREFGSDSQVIIVTHQKPTMETADVIYGVSLGQDGTSRVLSQRLTEVDRERSPLSRPV